MQFKSLLLVPLLLLVAACGTISNLVSETPKQAEYVAPAHESPTASLTLRASPEAVIIQPLAGGGANYLEASIDYIGTMSWSAAARDAAGYEVSLTEDANNLNYSGDPLAWNIGIDPVVPLSLNVRSASGALSLNLGDFTVTGLNAETSSGAVTATLPVTGQQYSAAITSSSGALAVTADDAAEINITALNTSSGSITLNAGSGSDLTAVMDTSSGVVTVNSGDETRLLATINSSSGEIVLNPGSDSHVSYRITTTSGAITAYVPADAAVRLEIVQNSSGAVTVPDRMRQISGDDKIGVWETDGFDQAERPIIIVVTRTSSGAVTVQ